MRRSEVAAALASLAPPFTLADLARALETGRYGRLARGRLRALLPRAHALDQGAPGASDPLAPRWFFYAGPRHWLQARPGVPVWIPRNGRAHGSAVAAVLRAAFNAAHNPVLLVAQARPSSLSPPPGGRLGVVGERVSRLCGEAWDGEKGEEGSACVMLDGRSRVTDPGEALEAARWERMDYELGLAIVEEHYATLAYVAEAIKLYRAMVHEATTP